MDKRATTPEQKQEVMERLLQVWLANPDMRLMQLLGNVWHIPSGEDPYYVEDYSAIAQIEAKSKEWHKPRN